MAKKTNSRECELCGGKIKKEQDNDRHYGTCPHCNRGSNYVIKTSDEKLKKIASEENHRAKNNSLLAQYDVIRVNKNSGVNHIKCPNLAKLIFNSFNFHFRTLEDIDTAGQDIYYYLNGSFHLGGENRIREKVDDLLGESSTIHRKNEVIDFIKNMNIIERSELEPPINLINLNNGIFNLDTGKLEKHNPKYFFMSKIPVNYVKGSKCPKCQKFFKEIIYENYIPILQEMMGYCLYRSYRYHKAFLFHGGGRNGKSTLQQLIEKLVGHKNYSGETLSDLTENRFSKARLFGKLVNLGGETSGKAIVDTSQFKHLTGNDTIRAENKNRTPFTFVNYAKLVFNANSIPRSKYDKTMAFYRRWIIIEFPRTFDESNPNTKSNIIDEITTQKELEGVLIWALDGLKRLLKKQRFTITKDMHEEEIGERYDLLTMPDKRFIVDHIKLNPGGMIPTDSVYDKYVKWAEARMISILPKVSFSRSMKRYLYNRETKQQCETKSTTFDGRRQRVYLNVSWVDDAEVESKKLESFGDNGTDLTTKISEFTDNLRDNADNGCYTDLDWCCKFYDETFVRECLGRGIIIKKPDGCLYPSK